MGSKRANGEGSVAKRKDGRWCARFYVNTVEGRKRRHVYGKTKIEAVRKMRSDLNISDSGYVINTENPTLKQLLESWLRGKEGAVKPKTYESYAYLVNNHILPTLGTKRVCSIQPQHLLDLYCSKKISGLSGRSIQLIHVVLHSALAQAVSWKMIAANVAKSVDRPGATKKDICPLTVEQVKVLFKAASGSRFEALYVLAVQCGMRRGELFGLRWSNVDLDIGVIAIRQQLVSTRKGLMFGNPKSGKGRSVKLSSTATSVLTAHRTKQAQERLLAEDSWTDSDLVFPSIKGTPMNPENLTKRDFKPLLKKAGLPDIRFHDLRHTFATLQLQAGEHPKVVQEILGHASIAITLDTYSHVLQSIPSSAAATMDNLFG